MRTILLLCAMLFATAAPAQPSVDGARGSTPPGTSTDGSRPGDGAITGGTLQPGESGGMPKSKEPSDSRCLEMKGTLREQCLRDSQGASTGGSRATESGAQAVPSPRTAPPPQNPRP